MVGVDTTSNSAIKISNKSFTWGIKIKKKKEEEKKEGFWERWTKKKVDEDEKKKKEEKEKKEKEEKPEISKLSELIHLKNIDIDIKKGEFVCIIGEIGSGKTNLFSTILGDMLNINEESIKTLGGLDREFKTNEEKEIFLHEVF